jgi:hypothetical protein
MMGDGFCKIQCTYQFQSLLSNDELLFLLLLDAVVDFRAAGRRVEHFIVVRHAGSADAGIEEAGM